MNDGKRPQAQPVVHVDNDRVVVTEWRFPVGGETGWHRHGYDYVVVPLTTGPLLIDDGSETRRVELATGRAYFRQVGVEHNVMNGCDHEFVFVEIELKTPPGG